MQDEALLREQVEYYRARATEYDEWFFRTGRYDRGPEHRAIWLGEVAIVEEALRGGLPAGAYSNWRVGQAYGPATLSSTIRGWWPSMLALSRERRGSAPSH